MSNTKSQNHSIGKDISDFTEYVKHCVFGTLKRFSKFDTIILMTILFVVIVIHHLLVINYIPIKVSVDFTLQMYDEAAKLINVLIPVLNEIVKYILDVIRAVASFLKFSSLVDMASFLQKLPIPKLPNISVSTVNVFILAFKNGKLFLHSSTIKSLLARFVGDEACFFARLKYGTILQFVSEILKFFVFYGGYKPIPNDSSENCNIQITTPAFSDTYIDILMFIIQAIMSFLIIILFFNFYKVLKNPQVYDI